MNDKKEETKIVPAPEKPAIKKVSPVKSELVLKLEKMIDEAAGKTSEEKKKNYLRMAKRYTQIASFIGEKPEIVRPVLGKILEKKLASL